MDAFASGASRDEAGHRGVGDAVLGGQDDDIAQRCAAFAAGPVAPVVTAAAIATQTCDLPSPASPVISVSLPRATRPGHSH